MTELRDKAVVLCECNIWSKAEDKATKLTFAAVAASSTTDGSNAQQADFAMSSGYT